jgi:SAM-dependent methyltransferase
MIYAKCCLCGKGEAKSIKKESSWNMLQCTACSHVYLYPTPDEAFLKKHYQSYLPANQKQILRWKFMMSGVFVKSLASLDKLYKHKRGKLFDIGCGHGFFLEMAKKEGWDVYGLDLCQQATEYAKLRGFNVVNVSLFEKNYKDNEFDVITMFYVLEHLPNPVKYLQEIYRILKPGGLLLLRVPHTTPVVRILKVLRIPNKLYDTPSHISDFSPATTKTILRNQGFINIHTFIGGTTYPWPFYKMCISIFFGYLADFLYFISFKRYLLPGVSKSTVAQKS